VLKTSSIAVQVAAHLREELGRGRWAAVMPGRDRLAKELGVNGSTIERALGQLEKEGLLQSQGTGKRRLITAKRKALPTMQVLIVLYEPDDEFNNYIVELRHQLRAAGHQVSLSPKTLQDLKHDPKRVLAMLKANPANTYIVQAAARPVLEYLSQTSLRVFALFGRMTDLPIAGTGPDKLPALRDAIDTLHRGGHRKIVLLSREERRENLSTIERVFIEELEKRGLSHSSYNLPVWEISPEGLRKCLVSLFQFTPPTAILVDDWMLVHAIQNHLLRERGLASLRLVCVCTDFHPSFHWCRPKIAHFHWDPSALVRRAVRWVDHVALGKDDITQKLVISKFVDSGEMALRD
jgi:DNA-binding LacI/PurR family transcriptional regulator